MDACKRERRDETRKFEASFSNAAFPSRTTNFVGDFFRKANVVVTIQICTSASKSGPLDLVTHRDDESAAAVRGINHL